MSHCPPELFDIENSRFVIPANVQSKLYANREVKLALRARFSDKLILSIVYQIEWIQVVDVILTPDYYVVPAYKTVQINTDQSKVLNHYGKQDPNSYSLEFDCPDTLCDHGIDTYPFTRMLEIRNIDFQDAGLDYWEAYTINATSTSDFIQGDGSQTSYGSVTLVWVPFDPEPKIVDDEDNYIVVDEPLHLEIDLYGQNFDNDIEIYWSTYPEVNSTDLDTPTNEAKFQIKADVLKENTFYNITVEIVLKQSGITY